ncbi:DNA-3-methyladenine glycosylase I [Luteimonas sp. FXH3W]|uniref:DNA-3-methyladenine glycosylase I n=1 Tax=Aquilutibacter rugosus TaxID=3115820 RepID=A0ABU7UZ50_9GAMM
MTPTSDNRERCSWATNASDEMRAYHDTEWGAAVHDDTRLFEKISLEGFQAGLNWSTILAKRPAFREVFHGFEIPRVATMHEGDVLNLLEDKRIIRHRGKIEAVIHNASRALEIQQEFGSLDAFVWGYKADTKSRPKQLTPEWLCEHTTSPESVALSKDLRKRGWKFVGPTTMYAFMQSCGLVNDHIHTCEVRPDGC